MGIGERLTKLREDKGYMQRDVAVNLGIAPNTLSGYERNLRKPDSEALTKLALFYNVTVDYLLGIKLDSEEDIPENVRAVARDLMDLPPENRKLAIDIIKTMTKVGKEAKEK